ncbi:endonuclease/exonuclease/phosphatase family protein [Rhodococcus daqingensis]|uniref:Endonuclease/exonuclease/phosphatase family protein n=1 Tax=Rhodococcus daqingensis TaxID=2479363 RepID=A0ABW2RSN1_9NOCA
MLPSMVEVTLDRFPVFAQATAFRVHIAVLALVGTAVLAWAWDRTAAAVLAVLALVSLGGVLPRWIGAEPPSGPNTLRLLVLNVSADSADLDATAAVIEEHGPAVVVLPEASAAYAQSLIGRIDAGYSATTDVYPPRSAADGSSVAPEAAVRTPAATTVLVREGVSATAQPTRLPLSLGMVGVTVRVGGSSVDVLGVHPNSPSPFAEAAWNDDLDTLRDSCRTGVPTVIAGDLNTTANHSSFRALIRAGCRDSAEEVGAGAATTWPADLPRLLGVGLDHVLTAGPAIGATAVRIVDVPGGHHRAVIAELVVR